MTSLTNCKNCGAPLSRYPCKCEYCGTVYGKALHKSKEQLDIRKILKGCNKPKDSESEEIYTYYYPF